MLYWIDMDMMQRINPLAGTEFIYKLDVDMEVRIIHLMNCIRYKLIRHDDDRVRYKWLEHEYNKGHRGIKMFVGLIVPSY
jgi:hypothetical protein